MTSHVASVVFQRVELLMTQRATARDVLWLRSFAHLDEGVYFVGMWRVDVGSCKMSSHVVCRLTRQTTVQDTNPHSPMVVSDVSSPLPPTFEFPNRAGTIGQQTDVRAKVSKHMLAAVMRLISDMHNSTGNGNRLDTHIHAFVVVADIIVKQKGHSNGRSPASFGKGGILESVSPTVVSVQPASEAPSSFRMPVSAFSAPR